MLGHRQDSFVLTFYHRKRHTGFLKIYPLTKNVKMTFCVAISLWTPPPKWDEDKDVVLLEY